MALNKRIYTQTADFPVSEQYGLSSQVRRAVTSIALNIAEGSGAESGKDYARFVTMARRSSYEVSCVLEIAYNLGYLEEMKYRTLLEETDEIAAMLNGLHKKLVSEV